jgi:DNA polymerase-3 subunit epsilon
MPLPLDAEPDYLALPDAPAVCIFESADARTILLAATASARDLARRRLAPTPDEARTARADLRLLCAGGQVHAIRVGSSLEADAVYLHQARARLPHLAKIVAERWRAWFVHVDPDAEFPQWTKTNLMIGLVGKRSASTAIGSNALPPGLLLGPLPDKDAAGRLIEGVIDCFDLCRYHNLLVQAPNATACAYKEMGRCPAPCDGSETMDRYRDRTLLAAEAITYGAGITISVYERGLEKAVAAENSEKAARIQKDIARLRTLDKPAFAQIRNLKSWQELLVLPAAQRDHATLALFDRGTLHRVADIDPADESSTTAACRAAAAHLAAAPPTDSTGPLTLNAEAIDTIALLSRWLFLPKAKRKGDIIHFVEGTFGHEHAALAASALVRSKKAAPDIESHEIEGA